MKTATALHLRWMIRPDLPEVMTIERAGADYPDTEETLVKNLTQRNCIAMVVEDGKHIRGFIVYVLHKWKIEVLKFVVAAQYQRSGIGNMMMHKLKGRLSSNWRPYIIATVPDHNLTAHLFLKAEGFEAIGIEREYFPDGADGYKFQFRCEHEGL